MEWAPWNIQETHRCFEYGRLYQLEMVINDYFYGIILSINGIKRMLTTAKGPRTESSCSKFKGVLWHGLWRVWPGRHWPREAKLAHCLSMSSDQDQYDIEAGASGLLGLENHVVKADAEHSSMDHPGIPIARMNDKKLPVTDHGWFFFFVLAGSLFDML